MSVINTGDGPKCGLCDARMVHREGGQYYCPGCGREFYDPEHQPS